MPVSVFQQYWFVCLHSLRTRSTLLSSWIVAHCSLSFPRCCLILFAEPPTHVPQTCKQSKQAHLCLIPSFGSRKSSKLLHYEPQSFYLGTPLGTALLSQHASGWEADSAVKWVHSRWVNCHVLNLWALVGTHTYSPPWLDLNNTAANEHPFHDKVVKERSLQ